jgi:GAF domain-containing protein
VATAVANAESRTVLARLAEEQAALRRVATLVAAGAPAHDLFAAVVEEVGQLLPVDLANMCRYEDDRTQTFVATWSRSGKRFPEGERWPLGGKNVGTFVFETRSPARIDDYADASGPVSAIARETGLRSAVGTPIIVEGRLWGMIGVGSSEEQPLPPETEERLASFTELVATAIANAESRAGLARLAEEQAALRRVATLVAQGAQSNELFAAVTAEVGQLLPVDFAVLCRYDPEDRLAFIAGWGRAVARFPPGTRWDLGGHNVSTLVLRTGRPARVDGYPEASAGPIGVTAREGGIETTVGAPILVESRLWGVMTVGSTLQHAPLPPDTEARLVQFTELLATAIANAESRAGLGRLAAEQAALRRLATLVARSVPQDEVFAAVAREVGRLLPVDFAIMGRYEDDGTITCVASWGAPAARFPVGSRSKLEGENLVTIVLETGRPARVDDFAHASGPIGVVGRESGFHSAVGAPIVVDGLQWGVMTVGCTEHDSPLPTGTETRLASFTELVATAISNAESRAELAQLAEQQAALRRVATLVARGTPPEELFAAVVDEVGELLPVQSAILCRYGSDGFLTVVATRGQGVEPLPVGSRQRLGGKNLGTIVFETGRPARLDRYAETSSGPIGVAVEEAGIRSSVGAPITVEGHLWGLIAAASFLEEPLPPGTESRLMQFTELVGTAIANAESRAALAASRARIVAAADESRRGIERDLHDGAQQRLVHAVIVLKLAQRALEHGDANGGELVAEALRHAEEANSELRELAHGILPAALTRGGLQAGVEALVSRVALPVSTDIAVERLPASVEATAYFVVSEALTNVVKHARADGAGVTARVADGKLRIEVRDDGVGGARGDHTTGLGGLEDRVSALGGRLVLDSPPGGGTRVCALLPVSGQS